ncbi:MAG: hypothetical protein NVS4B5_13940 [Vulcanimicrobiaceae bacterium]
MKGRNLAIVAAAAVALAPLASDGQPGRAHERREHVRAARFAGCRIFPPKDPYNADVSRAPTARAGSIQIRDTDAAARGQHFVFSLGLERLNVATSATPRYEVGAPPGSPNNYYHAEQFTSIRFPWQQGFFIEGKQQSGGGGGDDNHAITLDVQSCELYETYWTSWSGSRLGAYSGAHWKLSRPFVGVKPSAMASGLSLFAGAIRWDDDLQSGSIEHALNFFVPQGANGPGISRPAVFSGSNGPRGIDYGAHLRLHRNFREEGTPHMVAVIRALKAYGMYLADTSSPGGENGFFTITPLDGNDAHFDFGGSSPFALTDFDVVAP